MKKLGILFGILMVLFVFGCGGGGSGGGSDKSDKNPCNGPVPCLADSWGYIDEDGRWIGEFAIFLDGDGSPILLMTDGTYFSVGGYYEIVENEIAIIALAGDVSNCYDGHINVGGLGDESGALIYEFESASGNIKVCGNTLTISNIIIEGEAYPNVIGTFDSMGSLSPGNYLSTDAPVSIENVDEVKIRVKMLEQLMAE